MNVDSPEPFLKKVAELVLQRYADDLRKACIVLPNRRAGLFLKKHLALLAGKTIWSPETLSIEDFVMKYSGLQPADPVTLLLELYKVHADLRPDDRQELEEFSGWAQVVLKDFNELDLYLADPDYLFNYLTEAKAMALWSPDGEPLTEFQTRYLRFYQSLGDYYHGLRERLLQHGLAYQGMAYRHLAESIAEITATLPYDHIFFAGLNALTAAEEKITDYLLSNGKATILWDADEYYLGNQLKEAGRFIEAYLRKWPSTRERWIGNHFAGQGKQITITGVPGMTGQAKLAGHLLTDILTKCNEHEKVAVVLADERLLLPVLHSLPDQADDINITMGFPIRATSLYQFIRSWYHMQLNAIKYREARKESGDSYFTRDVLKVILHHVVQLWNKGTEGDGSMDPILRILRSHNHVFISHRTLSELFRDHHPDGSGLAETLFNPWADSTGAINSSLSFLSMLRDRLIVSSGDDGGEQDLMVEYAFQFYKIFNLLADQVRDNPALGDVRALHKVLFQVADLTRIPFYGEPLKGLQVMGLLETRALDFDHVILLGANEGVLPAGRSQQSFIPFDIRRETGLPTHHEKDAVFAYHFYRLLQRASNIDLVYNTESDDLGGGEQSRFITQVAYELPKYNSGTRITKQLLSMPPLPGSARKPIRVSKSDAVMERLLEKARTGFSPSVINLYISCRLKFYFQVVAGLAEEEDLEENIEARTLGNVMHLALRMIYSPLAAGGITKEKLAGRSQEIEGILRQAFREKYPNGDIEFGRNHLVFKAALHLLKRFIALEKAALEKEQGSAYLILSLEQELSAPLMEIPGLPGKVVMMKGTPDRIDLRNGELRIIDYKTGYTKDEELKFSDWDELFTVPGNAKSLQLLTYAWLYLKANPGQTGKLAPGIISFRRLGKGFMPVNGPSAGDDVPGPDLKFEEGLSNLIKEIFDPDVAFDQTTDDKNCEYCPYRAICNR